MELDEGVPRPVRLAQPGPTRALPTDATVPRPSFLNAKPALNGAPGAFSLQAAGYPTYFLAIFSAATGAAGVSEEEDSALQRAVVLSVLPLKEGIIHLVAQRPGFKRVGRVGGRLGHTGQALNRLACRGGRGRVQNALRAGELVVGNAVNALRPRQRLLQREPLGHALAQRLRHAVVGELVGHDASGSVARG
jgi:hypothetical protein